MCVGQEKDPGVSGLLERYFTVQGQGGKALQLSTWRVLRLQSRVSRREAFCWDVERLMLLDEAGDEATPLKVRVIQWHRTSSLSLSRPLWD